MKFDPNISVSISRMIDDSMNLPMLTPDQEAALVARWKAGDEKAFDTYIRHYLRIVPNVARAYNRYKVSKDDLLMCGFFGLVRSAKTYDPTKGSFRNHAGWWIKAEMSDFILSQGSIVGFVKTAGLKKAYYNYNRLVRELGIEEITPESLAQIAEKLENVSVEDVKIISDRFANPDISTDVPVGEDGDSTILDLLTSDQDFEEQFIENEERKKQMQIVRQILSQFSDREQDIFFHRHLADPVMTLEDLGAKYGVSRERIRQIDNKVEAEVTRQTRQLWNQMTVQADRQRHAA